MAKINSLWHLRASGAQPRILTYITVRELLQCRCFASVIRYLINIYLIISSVFSFNPDPTQRLSVWSLIIGGAFGLFPLWAVNQTAVQRFLTAKSNKEAKR